MVMEKLAAGNAKLMRKLGVAFAEPEDVIGTIVHVAEDGVYRGYIVIADEVKEEIRHLIAAATT